MLKKILALALFALLALPAGEAFAQDGRIAGTVVDSTSSETLPGVNVVVNELGTGAATDANGTFEIGGIPAGSYTLTVSFVGYATKDVPVDVEAGQTTDVRIQLAPAAVELEDIVVTALGIEREERSLGYAVEQVDAAELDRTTETNFIGNLSGKIAGATVSSSSTLGGSSRIVLRGVSSITGENQPLIVIDGVPLDNSNFNTSGQNRGVGGYDYGNAASLINPADVQSVSVLKGPSAAALYGSRAANGVIEVTTRSGAGRQGIGVTVQTGFTFTDLYGFVNYQNEYGGGSFAPFSENEEGQLVPAYAVDESWGPPLDGRMVREWFSYDDVNGMLGQTSPWDPHPDNVKDLFQTGSTWNTNVAFAQGGENFNYRTSVNNVMQAGVTPGSELRRTSLSFNGALDLTSRLRTSLSATYIDQDAEKMIGSGYDSAVGPFQQFNTFGQRQIDLSENAPLRDMRRPDGTQRSWNWNGVSGAQTGDIIYMNNPFWTIQENFPTSTMQRVFGNFRLAYDLMDDLTLSGSVRRDYYTTRQTERIVVGSVEQPSYVENLYEVSETNASLELNYDTELNEDFSLQALGGATYRYNNRNENLGETQGGLSTPGVYTLENSVSRPDITDYFEEQALVGLYADATVGFRDMVYVGGSVRNDWSSTLPESNNSYFYPSVRGSFVFTSLPALQDQDVLSFGKVRVGWAQVGRDTNPYELAFTYPGNPPFDGNPMQSLPNTLPNEELKPEIKTGWEVGAQLEFFNNRASIDATYYRDETENQILAVGRSTASGYTSQQLNTGVISNEGVELALGLTPVLAEDFRWDFTINWATNENLVEELDEGQVVIPGGSSVAGFGPNLVASEGHPIGSFFGTTFARHENGEKLVSEESGLYQVGGAEILGSYQPDWTGGVSTTLGYKGLSATVLVDGQKGGQVWSLSNAFGLYSGIVQETVENDIRELGVVAQGVLANGEPNQQRVSAPSFFGGLFGLHEAHLYDATYVKLREVTVSYRLPQQWLAEVPGLQSLTVALIGRNLATLYKEAPNFDPSAVVLSSSNAQGIEAGQLPPVRSYGFRLLLSL